MAEIQEMNKSKLQNLFNKILNLLRDNEYLTGIKALKNISNLIIFRLIEPKLSKEINIYDYDFKFEDADEEIDEKQAEKLIRYTKFSVIASEKEENIPTSMKYVWKYILAVHPKTKDIFIKEKGFDIEYQETYKRLFTELNKFNFEDIDNDILGDIYENVIKATMTGKVFGQFFTPPQVKQMIVKLVDPKLNSDGTIETICDPTMGTCGFLITALKHIRKQSKLNKIDIDWSFISDGAMSGKDCELDTYHLGKSNMFISTGWMLDGLHFGDSIRQPIKDKFDIVLANPPFGIKGLKYANIPLHDRPWYAPISTNNAVSLFLQVMIGILKVNGRCGVVLPYGKDIFGKTKGLKQIREYLMKTCDLKEVIQLPPGVFEYTSIKTCVFYFHKKKDVLDVVEKRNESSCSLIKEHSTTSVKFSEFTDLDVKEKKFILEVPIEDIIKNDYSLNVAEYVVEEKKEFSKDIVMMKLGDVCEFKNGKQLSKSSIIDGEYPVIGGGKNPIGYHNQFNRDENTILCASSGSAGYISKYSTKIWASDCFSICSKNKEILNEKYLYYYLINLQDVIYKLQAGTAQPHVYSKDLSNIQIPIPCIELQKHIADNLDFINESIATDKEKIEHLKKLNEIYLKMYVETRKYEEKKLGDVCTVKTGKYITKNMKIEGNYDVYGGGNVSYRIDQFNRENDIVIAKDGMSKNCVRYVNDKFFLNHHGWTLDCKEIIKKYIYYYLLVNQDKLYSLASGAAQKGINQEKFYDMCIIVPPLSIQKKIVEYCEKNDDQIKMLEENIKSQEQLCKQFISNYLGDVDTDESSESTKSIDSIESTESIETAESTETAEKLKKKISKSKIVKKSKIIKKV